MTSWLVGLRFAIQKGSVKHNTICLCQHTTPLEIMALNLEMPSSQYLLSSNLASPMGNQGFVIDNCVDNKFQLNLDSHLSLVK